MSVYKIKLNYRNEINHDIAAYPIKTAERQSVNGTCEYTETFEFDSADEMLKEFKALCIRVNNDSFATYGLVTVDLVFNPINAEFFTKTYTRSALVEIEA